MGKVPIHLLEAFVTFAESSNIIEAAQCLGITQPALSKQLKALESMLPHSLFAFQGRKKVLTPFGNDLHTRLKSKMTGVQDIISQTASIHSEPANANVRITARREILDRISGQLKFPGSLIFTESSNEIIVRGVLNREIDIGIVHQLPNTYELNAKPLFKDSFVFAVPKAMLKKLPKNSSELCSSLTQLPCIGYKHPDEILEMICGGYDVESSKLKIVRSTANYSSVASMVDSGIGWAVMPGHISISTSRNWIVPVSHKAFPPRQFFAIYRQEVKNVSWLKLLLSEMQQCFRDVQ